MIAPLRSHSNRIVGCRGKSDRTDRRDKTPPAYIFVPPDIDGPENCRLPTGVVTEIPDGEDRRWPHYRYLAF
jgi:hypothetical protein